MQIVHAIPLRMIKRDTLWCNAYKIPKIVRKLHEFLHIAFWMYPHNNNTTKVPWKSRKSEDLLRMVRQIFYRYVSTSKTQEKKCLIRAIPSDCVRLFKIQENRKKCFYSVFCCQKTIFIVKIVFKCKKTNQKLVWHKRNIYFEGISDHWNGGRIRKSGLTCILNCSNLLLFYFWCYKYKENVKPQKVLNEKYDYLRFDFTNTYKIYWFFDKIYYFHTFCHIKP